ncbi:Hsp20/alpha crystallin family protein [Cellulophaga sp. F20128]|uniref:Hsp20/alpha crystallin family protein n=1 Tax=Cellulophaga sp. F20128 TaxID=2926413 RepID=UPI001FF28628|nr:Hsp20/alpha crystallin family protein [Cellulophaga sp. F20128]MCK0157770.1 Hsp20/alpha crystallin family protein [Cellulophaga sp. F20128]
MSIVKNNNASFPSLLNEIFNADWYGGLESQRVSYPPVNIKEGEKDFTLEMLVPGRSKDQFNIEIDKSILTVAVADEILNTEAQSKYSVREFKLKSFKRTFSLPDAVSVEAISVQYENGILRFTLPKKEEALPKPKRVLEIA